ncbi:SDR family NAD(P)-dependent oxidoreductase [Polymorphobacter fuscus]|uniref:Glucose 1-dehydrogenase n=1 Tax=Sandarakinorhabdus fusca TaxID=1439888 RepID=A0A7C9GMR5_9SPHN|nr:glucose 1-dehydrogenase [Polymorphobacter fuscus]KAB7648656.1 glucose 1-dehydrogenase [Polymorphobacter fuscus]MQT16212.1 glucose 1-dehydrogenase [Polymorphobacter fuscus]NJC07503.1 NAD(P)-dependent dehydrogenase (short-subunit alcohol dehydrogenase family) [Polymorphobacter fuscus]
MAGRVADKIALVTGAASGLGAETARRLAAEGAFVMLTDRNPEGAEVAAAIGERADFMLHDVTSEDDWAAVVTATMARFGSIGVLVNNAGVAGSALALLDHDLGDWRRILSVNLDGVFLGLRHCGPVMAAKGGGSVINLSSILGKVGMAGAAAYCASKGGVTMLTKAAAVEWAPLGIRVNSVHPGFIDTPMVAGALHAAENGNEMRDRLMAAHPMARFGVPREIADAIVFLASDESGFMTGAELVVDGGYTAQ